MASTERFGTRLKEWRLRRQFSQEVLGEKIGSDGPRVHRLEKGSENPTLETLDKIAAALEIDVSDLLTPRSEGEPARDTGGERNPILDRRFADLLGALDAEAPAENTWRGDVLKAIAALNRALRREDPGESDKRAANARR